MKDKANLKLALGKKRRNNRLQQNLLHLRGDLDAAIEASRCVESSLQLAAADGLVGEGHYRSATGDCDALDTAAEVFRKELTAYEKRSDNLRLALIARASE